MTQAKDFLSSHAETNKRLQTVSELISGFETPYGMELLATVHWVGSKNGANSVAEAVAQVHSWNDRKRMFSPAHIELAWNVLVKFGLLA